MAENVNSKNATIAAAAPRTREEIAESLRVRTRRGTPTEKLEVIMTSAGLDRVEAATVMVIGLGGVGSNCVEALARGGVGHLIVIDHDIVGLSNINRQAIAFHSTLGRKKHEVVRDMVHDINPDCQVEALDMFLRADDVAPLLDRYLGKVDMLIDAIDSVPQNWPSPSTPTARECRSSPAWAAPTSCTPSACASPTSPKRATIRLRASCARNAASAAFAACACCTRARSR